MFGKKKMYKKGLADAMSAYQDFGTKQEEALAAIREEVRKGKSSWRTLFLVWARKWLVSTNT